MRANGSSLDDVSLRVIHAVADAEDVAPTEIAPLYETIDPDALARLFQSPGGASRADGTITFTYHGRRVRVDADGTVTVADEATH